MFVTLRVPVSVNDPEVVLHNYLTAWRSNDVEHNFEDNRQIGYVGRLIAATKEIAAVLSNDASLLGDVVLAIYEDRPSDLRKLLLRASASTSPATQHFLSVEDSDALGGELYSLYAEELLISFDRDRLTSAFSLEN